MGEPKPQRLQLSRRKGFNLQAASLAINGLPAISVARPGRFGNPFRVGMWLGYTAEMAVADFRRYLARDLSVRSCEGAFGPPPLASEVAAMRGNNLACWCAASDFCHADVLLELANAP